MTKHKLARGIAALIVLALACIAGYGQARSRYRVAVAPPPSSAPQMLAPSVDPIWLRAQREVYSTPEAIATQHQRELNRGMYYLKLVRGNPDIRVVALTFDDGPHPKYTPKLLSLLRRYNIKATFFVVGEMAEQYPDLVRAEYAAGHVVGNHTYHHANLTKIPRPQIPVEWQACQDVVKSITGETMRFCRPPGGDYNAAVIRAAMQVGLTTVLWTDDPGDYASPGDRVIETRVLDRVSQGGIILLHDGVQQTLDVLPGIIEFLRHKGYRFVTVADMQAQAMSGRAAKSVAGKQISAPGGHPRAR